jgi:hypothetical protein
LYQLFAAALCLRHVLSAVLALHGGAHFGSKKEAWQGSSWQHLCVSISCLKFVL